jgi:hypothetical protein
MVRTGLASNKGWEINFKDILYYIKLGTGWWGGFCKRGNELSGFIKCGELLD